MQRFQSVPPVGVIFDCDLGNDVDDALAMALLYGLDGKQECRVVATTVSKPNLKAAALSEVIGRFYAGQVSGAFMARGRTLPVGLATAGKHAEDTPMLSIPLARKTADGALAWQHGIERITDTADPVNVLRNALSAQHPGNAVVVLAGPATNLAALLGHPGAKPFYDRARLLIVAAGHFAEGEADPAILTDIAAARRVFAEWPTPLIAVGSEVGEAIPFPAASIEKDFAWAEAHPIVDAYRAYRSMPYDAPTTAMAAVLHAVREQASPFELSEPGTIAVLDDGRTQFTPAADGKHRRLIVNAAKVASIRETYIQLASAKPVPRVGRRPMPPPPKPPSGEAKPPGESKPATGAAIPNGA